MNKTSFYNELVLEKRRHGYGIRPVDNALFRHDGADIFMRRHIEGGIKDGRFGEGCRHTPERTDFIVIPFFNGYLTAVSNRQIKS